MVESNFFKINMKDLHNIHCLIEIKEDLHSLMYTVQYLYREGNQVADWLAQGGESGKTNRYNMRDKLPS